MSSTTASSFPSIVDGAGGNAGFLGEFDGGDQKDDRNSKFRMPPFIGTAGEKGLETLKINIRPNDETVKKHQVQTNDHDHLQAPTFRVSTLPAAKAQLENYILQANAAQSLEIRARIANRDLLQLGRTVSGWLGSS